MMDNKHSGKLNGSDCYRKNSKSKSTEISKVDINEIRKKFENLGKNLEKNESEKELNGASYTPNPPLRKLKSKNISKEIKIARSEPVNKNSKEIFHNILLNNNKSISVKERTKLFESNEETNNTSESLSRNSYEVPAVNTCVMNALTPTKPFSNRLDSKNVIIPDLHERSLEILPSTPPVKPPRRYSHSVKDDLINNSPREVMFNDAQEMCPNNSNSSGEDSQSLNNLVSKNTKPVHDEKKTRTFGKIVKKDSQHSLSKNTPSKTQGIVNYLKNLSYTANNICEKVKPKHTGIFVDLTPTTTSPPKRYGTLKKSHSEEHIYAEPATLFQANSQTSKENNPADKSLHYMCIPIVPPEPIRRKVGQSKLNSLSMRNMIYDSFSGIRIRAKENQDSLTDAISDGEDVSMKAIQDRIIYVKSVKKQISTSSLCLAPKLYEALFIVNINENQPEVSASFPSKISDLYKYPLLPHLCFPDTQLYKQASIYQSETFDFSLIEKGENVFGFCLRILGWPEKEGNNDLCVKLPVAICILSSFNASVFYKKVLTEIEKHLTLPKEKFFKYISSLRKLGVPNAGASLSIPDHTECGNDDRVVITRALDSHIVGLELTRALQLLDVDILVKSVASLLLERRVLLFSSSMCNLYQCCKAISSLLYPFEWPHLIIPALPACLTVYCCLEFPYILGISSSNIQSVLELLVEQQVLIIDVDKGVIVKSYNDEETILPRKVQRGVVTALNLAKNMTDPTEMLRDIMISEAFVHMYVEMIGHYENHFIERNGDTVLNKEGLLKNACTCNIRSFLQWFSETQMFDTFIEECKWRIKYRNICQTQLRTFFEKRIDEYKWELSHENEKISKIIGKTVKNFGDMIRNLKKN